ncbi:MAG TPA: thiamine phosphate synthase [Actinomycetota bacterium]|nr:thiamine phosphate synthase [Actinomycetota bacterium]
MTGHRPIDRARLRLYVVTSSAFRGRSHLDVASAAIEGGATAVQLRAPELAEYEAYAVARELVARSRPHGVLAIVNDLVDVAVAARADGVHVGQTDGPSKARPALGRDGILGVSVATVEDARRAELEGADYVGLTVRSTATKPDAEPVGIDGLRAVAEATALPVVAIGGIDAANVADAIAAGAAGVAVVSAVAAADDPVSAVRELRAAVDAALADAERTSA